MLDTSHTPHLNLSVSKNKEKLYAHIPATPAHKHRTTTLKQTSGRPVAEQYQTSPKTNEKTRLNPGNNEKIKRNTDTRGP